jgi:hypothetical protein
MFLSAWVWLRTPLGRQIGTAVILILIAGIVLRVMTNRAYESGRQNQSRDDAEALRKAADDAAQKARAELQQERDTVTQQAAANVQLKGALDKERATLNTQVVDRLHGIESKLQGDQERVAVVPDSGLSDLVRSLNAELRMGTGSGGASVRPTTQPR